jgi:hypothetical protein
VKGEIHGLEAICNEYNKHCANNILFAAEPAHGLDEKVGVEMNHAESSGHQRLASPTDAHPFRRRGCIKAEMFLE